jgi:hypothetical protein
VVVDPGDDFEIGAVIQEHPAHDVHLPQLHGTVTLPPTELVASLLAPAQLDQVVTLETAIDARHRRRLDTVALKLVFDPTRSPPRMLAPQLADHSLELGGDLVGTARGAMRTIGQCRQATFFVAGDPVVDALARDP